MPFKKLKKMTSRPRAWFNARRITRGIPKKITGLNSLASGAKIEKIPGKKDEAPTFVSTFMRGRKTIEVK